MYIQCYYVFLDATLDTQNYLTEVRKPGAATGNPCKQRKNLPAPVTE